MNRRAVPVVAACATATVFGAVGFGSLMVSLVFVCPVVAVLVYLAVARRRPAPPEARWTAPALVQPVLAAPGTPRQVGAALGRVESHELVLSVWFAIGLGLLAVIFMVLAVLYADDNGDVWMQTAAMTPWFAHPLAGMTLVASHRAVTRPARDGTDELFESCPTEPRVRTVALLRTAAVPAALFAGYLVIYGVAVYVRSPAVHGPVSLDALPILLAGPVLVAGAVCLGVALGSWVRFALAPVVAVVAVGMVALELVTAGDPGWNGSSGLSTFGPDAGSPLLHSLLPTWWYLLWIMALAAVVAVLALARFGGGRRTLVAGTAAVALAVIAASFATRPVDGGEARAVADLIARPAAHQTCIEPTVAHVEVCTLHGYGELRDRVATAVGPVAEALPPSARTVHVVQRFDGSEDDLPEPVVDLLPAGVPEPADDEVWVGFAANDEELLGYRLRVAFAALGLRLDGSADDDGPLAIDGEARGVVALWLASRGLDRDGALRLATVEEPGDSDDSLVNGETTDPFEHGLAWPTMCGPVVWSPQDLVAARAVLGLPEAQVAAVVTNGFDRWSDAGTGTDELLAELGLPSAGPYAEIASRRDSFC